MKSRINSLNAMLRKRNTKRTLRENLSPWHRHILLWKSLRVEEKGLGYQIKVVRSKTNSKFKRLYPMGKYHLVRMRTTYVNTRIAIALQKALMLSFALDMEGPGASANSLNAAKRHKGKLCSAYPMVVVNAVNSLTVLRQPEVRLVSVSLMEEEEDASFWVVRKGLVGQIFAAPMEVGNGAKSLGVRKEPLDGLLSAILTEEVFDAFFLVVPNLQEGKQSSAAIMVVVHAANSLTVN
mmetsp:Transcript_2312/g.2623  ORF Transcript_2312/g.2623 Transcript_2312/m.2623 type:complete len:237 (+) Transcript_2312:136-846(+)